MNLRNPLLIAVCGVLPAHALAADPDKGKELVVEAQCERCHDDRYGGGDGTQIYRRSDRKVNSLAQLAAQVSVCNAQLDTGWFPEEEAHVTAYLNARHYRFR